MPIERKDRSFDKIFDQVIVDKIPTEFIKEIVLYLADGTEQVIAGEDLAVIENQKDISAHIDASVIDVAIKLDYELIKEDVTDQVKGMLGDLFKDEGK